MAFHKWQACIWAVSIGAMGMTAAEADWPNSTSSPLQVGNLPGDNNIPQILASPDGGCYVLWRAWGSASPAGYATRLQRLDANGNELWPHNGVQIAPGDSTFTIVGGADMALCPDGSGVVVFVDTASDPANANVRQANVQKVSPSGALLWNGGTPVPVSTGPYGGAPGHVCAMPDGGCVVGYTVFPPSTVAASYLYFMRYTSAGAVAPGWNLASPPFVFQSGVSLILTCLQPGDPSPVTGASPGTFIASWIRSQTQSALATQKFNGNGTVYTGWNPAITIDSHGLTQHDFPGFLSDGNGGAIFGWHSYANSGSNSSSDAMLQHVLANGSLKFPTALPLVDPAFLDPSVARGDAAVAYNPADGSYFLAGDQGAPDQPDTSVALQKFDTFGNRLYTGAGFLVKPQVTNPQTVYNWPSLVATSDGGCIILGTVSSFVYGMKVNLSGGFPTPVWSNYLNTDSTTGKGRMSITKSATSDDALLTYSVGGGLSDYIAAVRVSSDTGAPGVVPVPPTITQDLPATVNACDGNTITLSIAVTGTPNISYSWQRHYAFDVSGNPDAFWILNDGDSAYGCIVPEDGTTYSGTGSPTLTITNVHALPLSITCSSGTIPTDSLNNSYRCVVSNAGSDTGIASATAFINVVTCQTGVCCQSDGSCTVATSGNPATCASGTLVVSGTCSPNTCPSGVTGTCCQGSTCVTGVTAAACTGANSAFTIGGTSCNASGNHKTPCCEADFNHTGGVTVQDIFDFLAAWFAHNPIANITSNGAGAPTVQSIFDFLAAWFAKGC